MSRSQGQQANDTTETVTTQKRYFGFDTVFSCFIRGALVIDDASHTPASYHLKVTQRTLIFLSATTNTNHNTTQLISTIHAFPLSIIQLSLLQQKFEGERSGGSN